MAFQFTELQEKWLQALESGEWRQCKRTMHSSVNNSHCCLAIACEIAGGQWTPEGFIRCGEKLSSTGVPTLRLVREIGLRSNNGELFVRLSPEIGCLAEMNDAGMTFAEIAAYIRANPENVFAKGAE